MPQGKDIIKTTPLWGFPLFLIISTLSKKETIPAPAQDPGSRFIKYLVSV